MGAADLSLTTKMISQADAIARVKFWSARFLSV